MSGINRDREVLRDMGDAERRISNVIMAGQVVELDSSRARVRVQAGDTTTDWIPCITRRASNDRTWHVYEPGEQVMLAAPGGDLNHAVVLGAYYRDAFPAPADTEDVRRVIFKDGTIEEYDRKEHRWLLDMRANDGTMVILTGSTQVIIGPHNVWIRADRIDLNDDR